MEVFSSNSHALNSEAGILLYYFNFPTRAKVYPNVVLKMKINKKSKIIELQKSPLVLEPYDPRNRATCIFEGYWDANKYETPITVLGCPRHQEIEVRYLLE